MIYVAITAAYRRLVSCIAPASPRPSTQEPRQRTVIPSDAELDDSYCPMDLGRLELTGPTVQHDSHTFRSEEMGGAGRDATNGLSACVWDG